MGEGWETKSAILEPGPTQQENVTPAAAASAAGLGDRSVSACTLHREPAVGQAWAAATAPWHVLRIRSPPTNGHQEKQALPRKGMEGLPAVPPSPAHLPLWVPASGWPCLCLSSPSTLHISKQHV